MNEVLADLDDTERAFLQISWPSHKSTHEIVSLPLGILHVASLEARGVLADLEVEDHEAASGIGAWCLTSLGRRLVLALHELDEALHPPYAWRRTMASKEE